MPAWHPVPTPVLPLSAARLPGVSTCKLGFNPNHNPGVRMGGGGRAYCCKQGKGTAGDATPSPPSPLPVFCPRKTGLGVSSALRSSLCGDEPGGRWGSEKGTKGQGVLSAALTAPSLVPNIARATRPLGPAAAPLQRPTWGEGQEGGTAAWCGPRCGAGAGLPVERPKAPCSDPGPPHLYPRQGWGRARRPRMSGGRRRCPPPGAGAPAWGWSR